MFAVIRIRCIEVPFHLSYSLYTDVVSFFSSKTSASAGDK